MSHYDEQYEKQAELDRALNRRLITAHIMSEYHQLAEEMKALKEELESLKQELTKRQGGAII